MTSRLVGLPVLAWPDRDAPVSHRAYRTPVGLRTTKPGLAKSRTMVCGNLHAAPLAGGPFRAASATLGQFFRAGGGFLLPGGDGSIGTYPRCCPLVTAMCAVLDVTGAGLAGTFRKGNL